MKFPYARGCGPVCPFRDVINGTCDVHGPTETDKIVERVTAGFRNDVREIMRSKDDENR